MGSVYGTVKKVGVEYATDELRSISSSSTSTVGSVAANEVTDDATASTKVANEALSRPISPPIGISSSAYFMDHLYWWGRDAKNRYFISKPYSLMPSGRVKRPGFVYQKEHVLIHAVPGEYSAFPCTLKNGTCSKRWHSQKVIYI